MSPGALDIAAFGRALVQTGDLDPVYIALVGARLPARQLARWMLAYWYCYHAGAASWLSEREATDFWDGLMTLAINKQHSPAGGRWPRGRERRHFRGRAATVAVTALGMLHHEPEGVARTINATANRDGWRYAVIRKEVLTLPMCGTWIAFKVADMFDRVVGVPVDFTAADVFMFDSPTDAALLWADTTPADAPTAIRAACDYILGQLADLTAPPGNDRPLRLNEVETILCKWKAHINGRYPIGIDTTELRHALQPWAGVSPTAARMLAACPPPLPAPSRPLF